MLCGHGFHITRLSDTSITFLHSTKVDRFVCAAASLQFLAGDRFRVLDVA